MEHADIIREELGQAGFPTTVTPEVVCLEKMRITPEKALRPMAFLFRLFGKPCFPRGELVAITGKAKSGKTYLTTMLMAACIAPRVLALERQTDDADTKPLRVLPTACGVPVAEQAPPRQEQLPKLNTEYILHSDEDKDGWHFDVVRLFLDAMRGEEEVGGAELRERVMQLSGVAIPFMYNKLLSEALELKIIEKSLHDGRTLYRPAPF